jgi:hypothetical protein
MLQVASDNAGIPSGFQIGADDIPNSGGSNPYANDKGARMVNNTLNHTQQLIQHASGRNDNDIIAMITAKGDTEMLRVFLADRDAQLQRDHEFRMTQQADRKEVVQDIVQKNQEVALDQNRTQLALYNASQRTNRINTNFHMGLQLLTFSIHSTIAILVWNSGNVITQMFRDIDEDLNQRLNITIPRVDAEGAPWWIRGIPHLINLFVAILQGAVNLGGFLIGVLTQFLAASAALGPAGAAAGIMFIGILFMIAVYFLMNIRRVRGFFAVGGVDVSVGEQQGAQALPQIAPAQPQQTHGVLNFSTRVVGMIENGNGRFTDEEERVLLNNRSGNGSSANGSGVSSSQLRLRNRPDGEHKGSDNPDDTVTFGGRRRTRRRRRKKRKTKRKKRRGRRKSKRRLRRKSRR